MRRIFAAFSVLGLLLAPGSISRVAAQQPADSGAHAPASPQLEPRAPRYTIAPQDVLALNFPLTPEMNQVVVVQPDGYVNLQNSISIHAQGLTMPELVAAVRTAYAGILREPIVNIDLQDYQKPHFTVTGQVGKPGQYVLRADTTLAEGLAIAGGLSPTAKMQVLLFRRTSKDWFEVSKVDMKAVFSGKHLQEDRFLQPGDMIYVPETAITSFRKYVPYSLGAGTYANPTIN